MSDLRFINNQINLHDIPTDAQVVYIPLDPNYRTMSLIQVGITFFILLIISSFALLLNAYFNSLSRVLIYFLVFFSLLALRLFVKYYGYGKKGYVVRQHDVLYKSGILWQVRVFIPKNRIQHIEIKKGPLEEIFDLRRLKIYTAGGSSSDLVIPGLREDTAEELKSFILTKSSSFGEEE